MIHDGHENRRKTTNNPDKNRKMGGYGSGRWRYHWAKTTVEECRTLELRVFRDALSQGAPYAGSVWWKDSRTGEETASVGFYLEGDPPVIRLSYTVTRRQDGERTDVVEIIPTTTTQAGRHGRQHFLHCPRCDRRGRKLYQPPGSHRFLCRDCHQLTYTSCQESHKWDSLYKTLAAGPGYNWKVVRCLLEDRYRE